MKPKILYIGYQSLSIKDSGGGLGCIRNHDALISLYGEDNVDTIVLEGTSKPSLQQKLKNNLIRIIEMHPFPIWQIKSINYSKYDIVFIDSSRLGNIAKIIKESGYKGKVIVFYHNFDYRFAREFYKDASFIKRWINVRVSLQNEKNAVKYADVNVILNERDAHEMEEFYGIDKIFRIPVSLNDRFDPNYQCPSPFNHPEGVNFLFIGSYFFGNVKGLDWFMENVYPSVNMNFVIVGKDMKKLRENPLYRDVEIHSDVKDIAPFIKHADYMIMPLIGGSGMKIKTCESLMFGKSIIGTKEAFEGYEIDTDKVGALCLNAEDFVKNIKKAKSGSFNQYSRDIFLEKYSFEATLKLFKKLIES